MANPKWWHFWNPMTGVGGGVVTGLVLAAVTLASDWLLGPF